MNYQPFVFDVDPNTISAHTTCARGGELNYRFVDPVSLVQWRVSSSTM
jgi:hypothetical protein